MRLSLVEQKFEKFVKLFKGRFEMYFYFVRLCTIFDSNNFFNYKVCFYILWGASLSVQIRQILHRTRWNLLHLLIYVVSYVINKLSLSGGLISERRNVERPIFRNFIIANIKITKDELLDSFIFEFNFSYFIIFII